MSIKLKLEFLISVKIVLFIGTLTLVSYLIGEFMT